LSHLSQMAESIREVALNLSCNSLRNQAFLAKYVTIWQP
jgi:hypothetical protein